MNAYRHEGVGIVLHVVSRHREIHERELLGYSRLQRIANVRHEVVWLADHLRIAVPREVAQTLNRDPSTIFHARRAVDQKMTRSSAYRAEVHAIRDAIVRRLRGPVSIEEMDGPCHGEPVETAARLRAAEIPALAATGPELRGLATAFLTQPDIQKGASHG